MGAASTPYPGPDQGDPWSRSGTCGRREARIGLDGATATETGRQLGISKQAAELESGLRTMVPGETFRLDVPGWFGA